MKKKKSVMLVTEVKPDKKEKKPVSAVEEETKENPTKNEKNKRRASSLAPKRPERLSDGGYNCKRRNKSIAQIQRFYNQPIKKRKKYRARKRTRQLALPKLRKLVSAKADYFHIIEAKHRENFDKMIEKTLLTIYTKLAKAELPPKESSSKKWTEEDWKSHDVWLETRAKPKAEHKPERIKRPREPLEKLLPRCESLAQPKNPVEKFNADDCELFSDPITKIKVPTKEIDYENHPWYQFLKDQVAQLNDEGVERRQEIEDMRHPQPLPPLRSAGKRMTSHEMFCKAIIRASVRAAIKSLDKKEQEKRKIEEHYRKIVDRKWLSIPPSERTQILSCPANRYLAIDIQEREEDEATMKRYKRAITAEMSKKRLKRLKKLMKIPKWMKELTKKEEIEFLEALKRYQAACNRKRLQEKPSPRIQKLARLTNRLLYQHRYWYYEWLDREETYRSYFEPKRSALTYRMPKQSRLQILSLPRKPRPKITRELMF